MSYEELAEKLKIMSQTVTEAIARATAAQSELQQLKKDVKSVKATFPYLIKRIGELSK